MLIAADDRGLAYGDGIFETLRLTAATAPFQSAHRQRMAAAAKRLNIPFDASRFDAEVAELLKPGEPAVGKIILTRGSGGRGYAPPEHPHSNWIVQRFSLSLWQEQQRIDGIQLGVCDTRASDAPHLAGMKHLNRLDQVLARQQVMRAGWDEGLMLDATGAVLELTSMNIFARFGDNLLTPSLHRAGVSGIARDWVCRQGQLSGLSVQEGKLRLLRLREADEVFACNSVAGILPVRKLAVWQWQVGEVSRQLQQSFDAVFK